MDVEAIARAQRRRQALEALEFQREREVALREQLETIVTERQGPRIDEAVYARMAPEDVELVRGIFEAGLDSVEPDVGPLEEDWLIDDELSALDPEEYEAELARLEGEIADSRRRQQALDRYLEALGV